jgi:hypothetical protein
MGPQDTPKLTEICRDLIEVLAMAVGRFVAPGYMKRFSGTIFDSTMAATVVYMTPPLQHDANSGESKGSLVSLRRSAR